MKIDIVRLMIPLAAIVLSLGTGMLKLYLDYQKRRQMFSLYHQQRMAAIEKGIELPPLPNDFFREDGWSSRRSSHGTLLAGLILLFLGLTLYLALHFTVLPANTGGMDVGLFALIPSGIGAACLVYYFAVGRKLAEAVEAERKARLAEAVRVKNSPA
ncbi:MAG: DUF6249 domain-containing protein [Verrucomicrobiota bacterium]|jgi:hypothetical protein